MAVQPIPAGYHTVTPYLVARDLRALVDFVQTAFGAQLKELVPAADGSPRHAEVLIGDSIVMMGQAREPSEARPSMLYLYVEDTPALYARAVAAGGESIMEPAKQFYGDVNAAVEDSNGNQWWIATHVEDVSPEELERRAKENS